MLSNSQGGIAGNRHIPHPHSLHDRWSNGALHSKTSPIHLHSSDRDWVNAPTTYNIFISGQATSQIPCRNLQLITFPKTSTR